MNDLSKDIDTALETSAKKVSDSLTGTVLNIAKDQIQKLKLDWKIGFKKLSEAQYAKCSRVKTLLYRYEPADLTKIYVPTTFRIGRKNEIKEHALISNVINGKRYIISGLAGSGKSMFMRFLCLHLLTQSNKPFPIFLELRDLNSAREPSILNIITDRLHAVTGDFTPLQLQYGLRSGTFTLILDGFDEVKSDFRDCIEKEILGISQTYPSCALLVSARPSSIFDSWTDFFCAEVAPLSSKAVSTLIKKLDFDLSVKQKFLDRVSDLYLSHKEFLSNPLLATMMLLTFDQYAEIPSKIHIFYEQAFQTLFNKHDALKSAFVRQSYSHLSIDDFRRYFSAFAFATYLDQVFSFDQNLLYTYVVKAKLLESIKVDEILYIKDLLESVCLLVKDGGVISFSHRSFQEYFSALYLTTANGVGIKELVTLILQRRMHDNVIDLAFDINRELLESKYIIPTIDEFISKSKKININKNCSAFFNLLFGSMSITNNKEFRIGFTISNSKFSLLLVNLHVWYRLYWEQELVDIGDKYDEDATIEIIKKFRANAEDWLTLTKVDDIWLEKTLIPDRLNRHYRVMSRLLSDLKSNHANKKKLLSEMLLDMKKESLKS